MPLSHITHTKSDPNPMPRGPAKSNSRSRRRLCLNVSEEKNSRYHFIFRPCLRTRFFFGQRRFSIMRFTSRSLVMSLRTCLPVLALVVAIAASPNGGHLSAVPVSVDASKTFQEYDGKVS